jgi:murein DD-endopeptidase MepM/ murein hydrolase activator NlpD
MRRAERRRLERIRRTTATVGFSFALGALVAVTLDWRLREREYSLSQPTVLSSPGPAPEAGAPISTQSSRAQSSIVGTTGIVAHEETVAMLRGRHLEIPVEGVRSRDVIDTFFEARAGHVHEAIDIMAPRHTPVIAVEDGSVAKLFTSRAGGLTIYQFDPTYTFSYYYAHLDRYASGLREGQAIRRGETIGYVGSTGNASEKAPHLHFAIFRLKSGREWWKGDPVNPYPVFK